jgi:hypothetical protein
MSRLRLSHIVPLGVLALGAGLAAPPASAATSSGTFSRTGTMNTARVHDTVTLLLNGEVLAAGQGSGTGTQPSAELYNPAKRKWTVTGAMKNPRVFHTATLLPGGQVLIAGGSGTGSFPLASAELFNPATGSWAVTGSMNAGRSGQSATLLPDGKVLVAGGLGASDFLASAELYNPATDTWAVTGSMTTPRENQSATLLNNGQVLVAGGSNSTGSLTSAELYNPATGKFTQTGSMTTSRETHDATLLPDGDVLVTAGVETSGLFSELYHPATGQWSDATGGLTACSSVRECLYGSSATRLGTGDVLVAGGFVGLNSNPNTTTSAMLYDPATNAWTTTGSMLTNRTSQTANLLPNGRVLIAGGASFGSHTAADLASAELYTP